jgi:hypothetical protein
MSLQAIYGFDGVGQGVQGASGDAASAPLNGMGIVNTRNSPLKINLYSPAAPQYNAVGVTGLAKHQVGKAGEKRNALILYRNVPTNNITAGARVMLLENFDARTNRSWQSVTGFTYIDFSDRNPGLGYALVSAYRNTSKMTLVTRRNDNSLLVGNVVYPIELGREYYIEVVMYYDLLDKPASSNSISGYVRINGEVIYTWDKSMGSIALTSGTVGVEVGFADHITNPYPLFIGVADVYQVDHQGEAPYNEPLGAQKVSLKQAQMVEADDWSLTGAADPTAALTDGSDASYIQTPLDPVQASLLFDLNLNAGSIVNGLQLLGRGSRDSGASRPITSSIHVNGADQYVQKAAFGTVMGQQILTAIMPSKTSEMEILQGSALSNLLINLDV